MSIKPQIRDGATYDIAEAIERLLTGNSKPVSNGCFRSCLSCTKFSEIKELCGKFDLRPPARVIAFGCPHYEDNDDIPF